MNKFDLIWMLLIMIGTVVIFQLIYFLGFNTATKQMQAQLDSGPMEDAVVVLFDDGSYRTRDNQVGCLIAKWGCDQSLD